MSKKTSYLLGILLTIGIGTLLYNYLCCNCTCNPNKAIEAPIVEANNAIQKSDFMLSGKEIDYRCSGNFDFLNSDFKTIIPLKDSIPLGIQNLKLALEKSKQHLTITGYALASEKNTSAFENLGLARANDVKNYFVGQGIDSKLIDIKGEVKDDLSIDETTVYGPVSFNLFDVTAETPAMDWVAEKEAINADPLILYFETGEASINLSDSDRKKVTRLTNYLDHVDGAQLDVVGHTDNSGKRTKNIQLGQGRAEFAADYLVSNGILKDKLSVSSKGPDMPIADNTTPEGKAKNRRTEVKIK